MAVHMHQGGYRQSHRESKPQLVEGSPIRGVPCEVAPKVEQYVLDKGLYPGRSQPPKSQVTSLSNSTENLGGGRQGLRQQRHTPTVKTKPATAVHPDRNLPTTATVRDKNLVSNRNVTCITFFFPRVDQ